MALVVLLPVSLFYESVLADAYCYTIKLPEPEYSSEVSVEEALRARRSVRVYTNDVLTPAEVSQLLWAAQGVTAPGGLRTAPSAGALYPLRVYIATGRVVNIPSGIYKYDPLEHVITNIAEGDRRAELAAAAGQAWIKDGAVVIVLSAVYARTGKKYNGRSTRYVHMEAGHAAQNIYLQAVSLHLGTVLVGAFDDRKIKKIIGMPREERPLGLMPVGRME